MLHPLLADRVRVLVRLVLVELLVIDDLRSRSVSCKSSFAALAKTDLWILVLTSSMLRSSRPNIVQLLLGLHRFCCPRAFRVDGVVVAVKLDSSSMLWSLRPNIVQLLLGLHRFCCPRAFRVDGVVVAVKLDSSSMLWSSRPNIVQLHLGLHLHVYTRTYRVDGVVHAP